MTMLRPVLLVLVPGLVLALGVWGAGRALDTGADAERVRRESSRELSSTLFGKYRRLALCIQTVEGAEQDAAQAVGRLRAALPAFVGVKAPVPGVPPPQELPPILDIGCPAPPARLGSGGGPRRVARRESDRLPTPSPYHTHVYLVSRATRESLLHTFWYGWHAGEPEEYSTDSAGGDVAMGVTRGLYTTLDELAHPRAVESLWESLWGLERAN